MGFQYLPLTLDFKSFCTHFCTGLCKWLYSRVPPFILTNQETGSEKDGNYMGTGMVHCKILTSL